MKMSKSLPKGRKSQKGQSFVELTLVVVFLMIFVAGIVEFGFALNNYLNLVDASREAVRYSSNFDPFDENGDMDPQFFIDTGNLTEQVLAPLVLDLRFGGRYCYLFLFCRGRCLCPLSQPPGLECVRYTIIQVLRCGDTESRG